VVALPYGGASDRRSHGTGKVGWSGCDDVDAIVAPDCVKPKVREEGPRCATVRLGLRSVH